MIKGRRIFSIVLAAVLLFAVQSAWSTGQKEAEPAAKPEAAQPAAKPAPVQLTFSTGSMGGGFFAIGGGIADYVSKNVEGVYLTAVTSGGVVENINRLDSGLADFGMINTQDPPLAWEGKDPYAKPFQKMRGIGILYMQAGQPFTLKSSGIKTYMDLKGKVVCAGSPGGSMHREFYNWVLAHGLDPEKDFRKTVFLPAREAMEALKTGQVDVVMEISTLPTPTIAELALTKEVHILEFAPGYRDKLMKEMPKYLPVVIPAGAYRGIDHDIETVGTGAMFGCRADLPDDLVYAVTKAVYSKEGLAYLAQVHAAGAGISLENATRWIPIPLHPGAEKFYKEKGLLK